jgi:hypothetical protein
LYRDFDEAFGSELLRMAPGDTITDKGFVSTSLKPVGKMQILAPAGAHAIAVMNHLPNQAAQEEVLLDRNSTFEYMRMTDDGVHVFKLREQQESLRNVDLALDDHAKRLTSMAVIEEAPKIKPNSRKVSVVAKELNDRAGKILKAKFGVDTVTEDTTTPEIDDFLSNVIAAELKAGLTNGKSSETWYSDTMQRAMNVVYELHPEIKSDPDKKFAFTAALAITSQGEDPNSSARLTEKAYSYFNKHGKYPIDLKVADPAITGNFKKMNAMIAEHGVKGTKELFDREFTVRELLDATGYRVGKTNMDTKVNGSAILGPKIGLGFYQNLNGNFEPVTMDMWFMRAWGRITNTGMGTVDIEENAERLRKALRAEGKRAPKKLEDVAALAQKISDEHEKRYKSDAAYRKAKPELALAAERFNINYEGALVDTPRGGNHRNWMTKVFKQAVDKLKQQGVKLNPASAQATWWHPEQVLYKRLGVKVRSTDNDYAKAFARLAAKG